MKQLKTLAGLLVSVALLAFTGCGVDEKIWVDIDDTVPTSVEIDNEPLDVTTVNGSQIIITDASGNILSVDKTTRTVVTSTYPHHGVHEGGYFYVKGFGDGTQTFLWKVPDTTHWPHANWSLSAEGEFDFKMYEDVVVSANGSAVTIFNANRNSSANATVLVFSGPTLNSGTLGDGGDGGTLVWDSKIGSGKDAGIGVATSYEFIGKQGSNYWFQMTQIAAGELWVDWDFNWYEHTDKD